jgi:hypothetical protein
VHAYKVQKKFYHLINGMEPVKRKLPCFLQAYVHDATNESPNGQMQNPNLNSTHLTTFCTILRRVNPYVNIFIRAADHLAINPAKEVHICITFGYTSKNKNDRYSIVLMANEVGMMIHGEPREVGNHNVIVQYQFFFLPRRMNGLKICGYRTIKTNHAQWFQWWLITHT